MWLLTGTTKSHVNVILIRLFITNQNICYCNLPIAICYIILCEKSKSGHNYLHIMERQHQTVRFVFCRLPQYVLLRYAVLKTLTITKTNVNARFDLSIYEIVK